MARRIAGGDWLLGAEPFAVGPLYAYFVGVLWGLFESNLLVFVIQSGVGLGSVYLVTRASRALASTAGACGAGCAFALYAPAVILEGRLLAETLAVFMTLASIHLLSTRSERPWQAPLSGGFAGAAALLRPDLLLAIPVLGAALLLLPPHPTHTPDPSLRVRLVASARSHWRRCAVFLAAAIAVVGLATGRNWVVLGEPVIVSTQGGITFYQGNNDRADGTFSMPSGFSGRKLTQEDEARNLAEKALGSGLGYGEVSAYWYEQGFGFLIEHPDRALELFLRKLRYWTSSMELSADYSVRGARCLQPALAFAFVPFGAFLVAALFGWRSAISRAPRRAVLHLSVAAVGLVVGLVFYVSTRYRLCAAAHLAVFLGPALDGALGWQRSVTWSNARRAAAVCLLGLSLVHWTDAERLQAATELRNLGVRHYEDRQPERAVSLLLAARNARPDNWEIRYSLAHALGVLGDTEAAAEEMERALALRPDSAETRRYLEQYRVRKTESRNVQVAPICEL